MGKETVKKQLLSRRQTGNVLYGIEENKKMV